jgi:hypothetical protein
MFKEKLGLTGQVQAKVFSPDGSIKRFKPNFWQRLFKLPGSEMICINHNIVTSEGDALIVDMLVTTGTQTAMDNANAEIGVGTGFSAETKGTDALVTQTGSSEEMDATYPLQKGAFSAANDDVLVYRSTFEAGDLNDTGIDEALLGNGTDTLAYAEISPSVNVTTADTLEVTWELTFLGS